jgi:hypothetical protein
MGVAKGIIYHQGIIYIVGALFRYYLKGKFSLLSIVMNGQNESNRFKLGAAFIIPALKEF